MTRKAADKPPPRSRTLVEREWHEAGIIDLLAEARYYDEESSRLAYERMERETDYRARREYDLSADVSSESAYELVETLSDWTKESHKPITLRIMSPGGDIVAGLAIYDFVLGLRGIGVPVDTLALGEAASMASVLLQCGRRRLVSPNAFVLIHEERTFQEDQPVFEKITDMEDRLAFLHMLEARCTAILAERSEFTSEQLAVRFARKDWWMPAEDAVHYGFADELWAPGR